MINSQQSTVLAGDPSVALQLASGQVIALGHSGGDIAVIAGRVWLTRSGDPSDHVLGAGEVLKVGSGGTVVESWNRNAPAVIAWQPKSFGRRLLERFAGHA